MKKLLVGLICFVLVSCLLKISFSQTSGHQSHIIVANTNPDPLAANPLKGWVPYENPGTNYPYSMEMFYVPLSGTQTGFNTFDWSDFERKINSAAYRACQSIVRFYLDYPGRPSAIPQFLLDDGLVIHNYTYNGGGIIPDYEDQNLRIALINFIAAFGLKYNGDSRLAFIEVGLLGFWGEWHCGPYNGSANYPNFEPSVTVRNEILKAYQNAFTKTQLLCRSPNYGNVASMNFGYHDDSFGFSTLPYNNWHFMDYINKSGEQNNWENFPNGGELRPEVQAEYFSKNPWGVGIIEGTRSSEPWNECLAQTHISWLMNYSYQNYSGPAGTNAILAASQMGYDFRVINAYYDNISTTDPLYLGIDVENIGVAPFYYEWEFKVGVKQNGTLVNSWSTGWNLRIISADKIVRKFEYSQSAHGLPSGTYNICIKIINPLPNGRILSFSNLGQNTDGWLDLGSFVVTSH